MIRRTRTRRGTTLVELLVASAMSIMIMWLLTWCYQQGLASFSNTRSHAELMDQQRMVTSVLTRDLLADHFLTDDSKPNGGRKVRDQSLYDPKYTGGRNSGFFYAYSPQTGGPNEGYDADGFASSVSTNHLLQFTSILPGGPAEQLFNADVPFGSSSTISGRAAEISYFLVPSGQTLGGTPLNNLIRRQRVCALTTDDKPAYDQLLGSATGFDAGEVMAVTNANPPKIFTLNDLAVGPTLSRLQVASRPIIIGNRIGEDILMSNVVSFEVKFTGAGIGAAGTWPTPLAGIPPNVPPNADYPYDNLPTGNGFNGIYDTNITSFNGQGNSAKVRITGVQIRLRSHDPKSRTTRQTTVIINL